MKTQTVVAVGGGVWGEKEALGIGDPENSGSSKPRKFGVSGKSVAFLVYAKEKIWGLEVEGIP